MRVRASGSFRRYALDRRSLDGDIEKLRPGGGALEKKLHANRFRSIDAAGSAVSSCGWSRQDGTVPREFSADEHWLGDVLALALRVDRKRLPAGALRVRRSEAEAAERRAAGERIAPARRREIAGRIESELLARVVPSTALHAMLWHAGRGEVLFQATADPANEAFRSVFRETFGGALEPLVTAALAPRLAPRGATSRLARLAPASFAEGAAAALGDPPSFLGGELLLWLWHRMEAEGGRFELPQLGTVGVAFGDLLELGSAEDDARVSVRGESPSRSREAASALLSGRLPRRARLLLARGERSFEVTLAAETLDLEAVKVEAPGEEIADEHLRSGDEQRAKWLFELSALVDAVFGEFLKLRLSPAFDDRTVPALRDWILARSRVRMRAATA